MMEKENWSKEELELSERETAELAGWLALSEERKPPAALRERVLSSMEAAPSVAAAWAPLGRWAAASGAFAALFLAAGLWTPTPAARLASTRGLVTVDGRAASSGAALRGGQVVTVSEDGQAVIAFNGRAAIRLLHGGTVSFKTGAAVEVALQKGWALSAVKKGASYSLATKDGRVTALGTDYLVKAQPKDTWLCICHGRIGIEGRFPTAEAASDNHGGWVFEAAKAPRKPDYGTLEGHGDEDISSLRAFLAP